MKLGQLYPGDTILDPGSGILFDLVGASPYGAGTVTFDTTGYRETAPIPYLEFCTDKEPTLFFSEEDKQISLFPAGVFEVTFARART